MSRLPASTPWSHSHNIPIYLDPSDTGDKRKPQPPKRTSERTCPTCETSSRQQPIHCIKTTSRAPLSPAPPPYHSITPHVRPSKNLAVPVLNVETSRRIYQPQRPRPALRSHINGRPHVRFRHSTSSQLSPRTTIDDIDYDRTSHSSGASIPNTLVDDIQCIRKSKLGLGITEVPFKPDPSPIRSPNSEKLATAEKGEFSMKSPNIAQRIEEKLWKYSASNNVVKRWLLEIISWCISAVCMAAIIIVLYVLHNKPVPTWGLGLTLNAYISILSKVASAALLLPASEALGQLKWSWFQRGSKKMWDFEIFDNASRGPWGSFMLLIRTKGTTLAALGAAVTIFAMALDPFFQQVVHNPEPWLKQESHSSIPKVTRFESPYLQEFRFDGWAPEVTVDQDIQTTADKFFFNFGITQAQVGNGTRAEIPLSCPTSNCTWEPYETLGVCSECTDVANMLEFACLTGELDWIRSANSFNTRDNGTMCGWFFNATEADPLFMFGYEVDPARNRSAGEILTSRALPLVTNLSRRPFYGDGSINFKHVRNRITDFVVVSATNGSDPESVLESMRRRERPRALECMLAWCVKTIESSYYLAAYTEIIKDTFINTTAEPYPWTGIVLDDEGTVKYRYTQNITVNPHALDNHGNASDYGTSNDTAFNIITIFDDYLPSFATAKTKDSKTYLKYRAYEENPFLREYIDSPWSAPNNVTRHMERLATAITNVMRSSSKENVTGSSFSQETIVEVHWWWLTLPVGLLLLTLIFLVATVIRTSMEKDRVGVWKTSAIATLLYGLPDNMQQKIVDSQSQAHGTPRQKAKKLKVRMLPSKGWRISGNMFSPATPRMPKPKVVSGTGHVAR
ncbi:hypothetical protein K458DRAFT_371855 [Lentithecium fluviatile CBS 122367]|uniref:DUF3176 domain-containing protein n=1 Tax=Lentithecium fluviatile CBS 122367 TaxID=1168545 RepID=A0A6G1IU22_9PLEO|nr:hypothetical protein K458DRAFT_371855 [Lentithecium fluviatile CBS 122367]